MTAALSCKPSSVHRIKLASVSARECLHFRFDLKSVASTAVLFAHQNFKDELIQWPEKLLPVEIIVEVDPSTLHLLKISYNFEDSALKAHDPQAAALSDSLSKCRKLIRKKILTAHYTGSDKVVQYPGESPNFDLSVFPLYRKFGDFPLYELTREESEASVFWKRFEWLMLFFVDATQNTDSSDPRWKYFVLSNAQGYVVLGFSMYIFPTFPYREAPGVQRWRIGQFMTVPAFQGKGHAEKVMDFFQSQVRESPTVDRLTLEDASEGMLALRNVVLLKVLAKEEAWMKRIADTSEISGMKKELGKYLKVANIGVDRLIDTILIAAKFKNLEYDEQMDGDWWVKTNYIRRIKWVPEELEAMADGDQKQEAKREFFEEEWESYVETACRAWKRVFRQ